MVFDKNPYNIRQMTSIAKTTPTNIAVAEPVSIGLLVLPAFNSMAVNAFIDPFRAANYLRGQALFRWQFLSLDGGSVLASNGMSLGDTTPYEANNSDYDLLVVNASWTPENFQDKPLQNWLRKQAKQGTSLVGIDTGAFVLAYAGLMKGYQAVVHYEHLDSFLELFSDVIASVGLYAIDRDRMSCCGGLAAADLALEIIHQQHGMALANAAARYIFQERLRGGSEKQLSQTYEPIGHVMPNVLRDVLLHMEQNLEEIVPVPELARQAGVSQRQLERLFNKHIGLTPKRYYLNIRLNRARSLLTQTELAIAEVASACGFNSTEHFTRMYRSYFDLAPSQDRTEGRVPFQFRPRPAYSEFR